MYHCPYTHQDGIFRVYTSITVNVAAHKLYLYINGKLYKTYPVGIGKMLTPASKGTYRIVNKGVNPGGPYGARWLGLSKPHCGIHGTDDPSSIGKLVPHGCIRMHNKDVIELSNMVSIGTPVKIV